MIPSGIVDRLLAGENRVRVWREHRGALAEQAGIAQPLLWQIETGRREGAAATLRKIADDQRVPLADLAG